MTRKDSPIRLNMIEETRQMLEQNKDAKTIFQKINYIFTDRTKIEDGLSIKELALILYPDLITVNEMLAGKKDLETWNKKVFPTIKKTRMSVSKFRDLSLETWPESLLDILNAENFQTLHKIKIEDLDNEDEASFTKIIFLFPIKSKNGEWLYYNIQDKEGFNEIKTRYARLKLIQNKKEENTREKQINILHEMTPEEREENKALISDIEWAERFNEFSKVEFLRRHRQYFNVEWTAPKRVIVKIETNLFGDEVKDALKSLSLIEQYEYISDIYQEMFFEEAKRQKLPETKKEIEALFMQLTLLLDPGGSDLLKKKPRIKSRKRNEF
ncbi:MAG: hypothetical protein ACR2F1_12045 [Nitrososphaeraceae archaeon]